MVTTLTNANFEAEVTNSDKPVLVDFWASWCGPCRMVSPIVDQIAEEYTSIKVGKVNVDDEGALAERFSVMSIPTLIVFRNGQEEKRIVGARPKEDLVKALGL